MKFILSTSETGTHVVSAESEMPEDGVSFFTIFERPRDYPNHFVVRRFDVHASLAGVVLPCGNPSLADSLEAARAAVPAGCANVGREPGDDAKIVESWMYMGE